MKHKGLVIACIVLLSALAVGLIAVLILSLTGVISGGILAPVRSGSEVIYDEAYSEELTVIDIYSECGDVIFENSSDNDFHLTAYGEGKSDLAVTQSSGTLRVKSVKRPQLISFGTVKNDIVISVPSDYSGDIKVSSAYGNVTLCDLPSSKAEIDCDYGSVSAASLDTAKVTDSCGDVSLERAAVAEIEVDLGKIHIGEITRRCRLENDCGDIKVDTVSVTENSEMIDDLGKITVGSAEGIRVNAETDLGSVNVNGADPNSTVTLTISNSCGDITVGK